MKSFNPKGSVKKSNVHRVAPKNPNQINATDKPQRTFKGKSASPYAGKGSLSGKRPVGLSTVKNKQAYVQ